MAKNFIMQRRSWLEREKSLPNLILSFFFTNTYATAIFSALTTFWVFALLLFINVYAIFMFFHSVSSSLKEVNWRNFMYPTIAITQVAVFDWLFLKRNVLRSVLTNATFFVDPVARPRSRFLFHFCRCSFLLIVLLYLPLVVASSISIVRSREFTNQTLEWIRTYCFELCSVDGSWTWVLQTVDQFFGSFTSAGVGSFLLTFSSLVVYVIVESYAVYHQELCKGADNQVGQSQLRKMREDFRHLHSMMKTTDNVFSIAFFMYYGAAMMQASNNVYHFFTDDLHLYGYGNILYFSTYSNSVVVGFLMAVFGSIVSNGYEKIFSHLRDSLCFEVDEHASNEFQLFVFQVSASQKGLTVGGCILLSGNFLFSYYSVLITYALLMFQFLTSKTLT